MDLIPAEFRQAQWAKRFVRRIARAVLVIGVLCAVSWLLLFKLIHERERDIAQLLEQDGSSQQQQTQLEELRQRKQSAQQQLDALSAVRGGERVADLLNALDGAYQQGVWLNRLTLHPRDAAMSPKSGATAATSPNKPSSAPAGTGQIAELGGYSVEHQSLALFMTALGKQPSIARVELLDTRTTTFDGSEVLEFSLVVQLKSTGAPS